MTLPLGHDGLVVVMERSGERDRPIPDRSARLLDEVGSVGHLVECHPAVGPTCLGCEPLDGFALFVTEGEFSTRKRTVAVARLHEGDGAHLTVVGKRQRIDGPGKGISLCVVELDAVILVQLESE